MPESNRTRLFRHAMNVWPCYRGTGGRVAYIASDWSEVRVRIALGWRTRNYVGTIFGGSLYGVLDPIYMIMLIHRLGEEFLVWDKSATIRFRKPGRGPLTATFRVDDAEVSEICRLLETERKIDRIYRVELIDADGAVHVEVDKVVNIRKK